MTPLPRELGYHMPAEWEHHAATWLSWPHKQESWPGKFDRVPDAFAQIVRVLSSHETVQINVNDASMEASVKDLLRGRELTLDNIRFHKIPTNDAWCRDHGPIFLVRNRAGRKELAAVNWRYNAWGEKYLPYDLDDQVPTRVAEFLRIPCFSPEMVLEGGSIDVNGQGTLMTTESCLLNANRNPHLTKGEVESYLEEYLGVTNILWLGEGIAGDDTDGHIDDLCRFVNPTTVAMVVEDDPGDENYRPLRDNLRRLELMRDQSGHPLEVATLPMPPPSYYEGQRLPASYANFYIANDVVLVPTYNCRSDAVALKVLEQLFPLRRVVGMDCTDLVWGLGAFHCVTQQQPSIN